MREYVSGRVPLAHVDLYRLDREQDVLDLALDELEDGERVLLVEWGDPVAELIAEDRLRIEFVGVDPTGADETRRITFQTSGGTWADRRDELAAALERWTR